MLYTARFLAELKGLSIDEFARLSTQASYSFLRPAIGGRCVTVDKRGGWEDVNREEFHTFFFCNCEASQNVDRIFIPADTTLECHRDLNGFFHFPQNQS